jgi:predicted HicB family RNase H-like nuclease
MRKPKEKKTKENKTKTITIRIAPTVHDTLIKEAAARKISLSKFMTESSLAVTKIDNLTVTE